MYLQHKQVFPHSSLIEELYQRYWLMIFIAIRQHVFSKEEAEDILLEVFLAALENPMLVNLSEHQQLAWLRRVAYNKCMTLLGNFVRTSCCQV
jgi:RNA polymerase sigma-70 factor, ECF subfamily